MDPSGFTSTHSSVSAALPALLGTPQPVFSSAAGDSVTPTTYGSCSEGLLVTAATRDAEISFKGRRENRS